MSAVFISYRRDDSAGHTGRLYDHLYEKLGKEYVFMDIDTIEPGMDFVEAIDKEIKGCSVLIVVIGDEWLTASDENGRRLDDPNDFIHIEIRSALRRSLRIIPVLVKGAKMPAASELPDDIAALSRRHALELSDSRWDYDIKRLLTTLATSLDKSDDKDKKPADPDKITHAQDGDKKVSTIAEKKIPATQNGRNNILRYLIPVFGIGLIVSLLFIFWPSESITNEKTSEVSSTTTDDKATDPGISITTETEPEKTLDKEKNTETRDPQIEDSNTSRGRIFEAIRKSDHEARIKELIANAEQDVKAFRLTSPVGNNAVEKYKEILELEPDHPAALEGIEVVAVKYMELARSALTKGQPDKADAHLEKARYLFPAITGARDLQENIALARQRLNKQQQVDRARDAQQKAQHEAQITRDKDAAQQAQIRIESCLSNCEKEFHACQKKTRATSASDCDEKANAICAEAHEACLNDPQVYILWGEFGTEAECNGRQQQCINQQIQLCQEQADPENSNCESVFATCQNRCR